MIRLKVNNKTHQFNGDPDIHKAAELTASNATQPAKTDTKASGAGTNRLSRKGGNK